jgi:hypothetical protein
MRAMMGRPASDFASVATAYHLEVVGPPISPVDR